MHIIFISKHGDILPLAERVEKEGNTVQLFIASDDDLLVDRHITDSNPDMIVFDSYGFGKLAHRLKRAGFNVVGSMPLTDVLENEQNSEKIIKMCGIPTDYNAGFTTTLDGWFNGKGFINFVYTVDDIVFPGNIDDKLIKISLMRLVLALKKAEYQGPVMLTANISKDKVGFSNLRARFSPSTLLIMREGLKTRATNVLQAMATGYNKMFMFKPGFFASVQISVNPNPLFNTDINYEIDAQGLTDEITKHVWLYNFQRRQDGSFFYRGRGGRIAVATSRGDTIREARRRVYRTAINLKLDGMLYLREVGKKATSQCGWLKDWGLVG